jgi:hypothetical protein
MSEDPSLAAGSACTLTLTECLHCAGRAMYGAGWIFGLSPTERARMVQYSDGTLPADPAICAEVERIRDRDGLARVQRRQVLRWIESCGFSTAGGARIDEATFERALARDFARHSTPMPPASDPPASDEDGRDVRPWWRRRERSIARFTQRQRTVRRWLAFREIADWCACAATGASADDEETARTLAYQRLDQSARNGEFDRNERCRGTAMETARSKILFLDTYIAGDLRTPKRCRLNQEQIEFVEDIRDLWARCWLPSELARQWLGVHGYPWPPHFEPAPKKPTARAIQDFDVRLGWIPLTAALEIIRAVTGDIAWEQAKNAIALGALPARCQADGVTRDLEPHWLDFLAWDRPDGDVLWFDREKAWGALGRPVDRAGVLAPDRAENIVVPIARCAELWPGCAWPETDAVMPMGENAPGAPAILADPLSGEADVFDRLGMISLSATSIRFSSGA